jgi:hypothetical protein
MSFSMTPLLLHRQDLPDALRLALRAAYAEPVEQQRTPHLESAARILRHQLDLDCRDARELVGLPDASAPCD